MKMDGQIRVRTNTRYGKLYNDLKNLVVGDFHELFFICACLGFKCNRSSPLDKTGEDRFWSSTITPHEWVCFYSMVLKQKEMDFHAIQEDKVVIAKIEEYADAGMAILLEEFLGDYLMKSGNELRLDSGYSKELPKNFLHFVFDQVDIENGRNL